MIWYRLWRSLPRKTDELPGTRNHAPRGGLTHRVTKPTAWESTDMDCHILVSDNVHEQGIDLLASRPGFHVDVNTGQSPEALKETIGKYQGLVIRSATKVTREDPERCGEPQGDRSCRHGSGQCGYTGSHHERRGSHEYAWRKCGGCSGTYHCLDHECAPSHSRGSGIHEGGQVGEEEVPGPGNGRENSRGDRTRGRSGAW